MRFACMLEFGSKQEAYGSALGRSNRDAIILGLATGLYYNKVYIGS